MQVLMWCCRRPDKRKLGALDNLYSKSRITKPSFVDGWKDQLEPELKPSEKQSDSPTRWCSKAIVLCRGTIEMGHAWRSYSSQSYNFRTRSWPHSLFVKIIYCRHNEYSGQCRGCWQEYVTNSEETLHLYEHFRVEIKKKKRKTCPRYGRANTKDLCNWFGHFDESMSLFYYIL